MAHFLRFHRKKPGFSGVPSGQENAREARPLNQAFRPGAHKLALPDYKAGRF
jgi:hypothetical protein